MVHKPVDKNGQTKRPGFPIGVKIGSDGANISVTRENPSEFLRRACTAIEGLIGPAIPVRVELLEPRTQAAVEFTQDIQRFVAANVGEIHAAEDMVLRAIELLRSAEETLPSAQAAHLSAMKSFLPEIESAAEELRRASSRAEGLRLLVGRAERQTQRAREDAWHTEGTIAYLESGSALADARADMSSLQDKLGRAHRKLDGLQSALEEHERSRTGLSAKRDEASQARAGRKGMTKPQLKKAKRQASQSVSKLDEALQANGARIESANAGIEGRKRAIKELEGKILEQELLVASLGEGGAVARRIEQLNAALSSQKARLDAQESTLAGRQKALQAAEAEANAASARLQEACGRFRQAALSAADGFNTSFSELSQFFEAIMLSAEKSEDTSASFKRETNPADFGEFAPVIEAAFSPADAIIAKCEMLLPELRKIDALRAKVQDNSSSMRNSASRYSHSRALAGARSIVKKYEELAGAAAAFLAMCKGPMAATAEFLRTLPAEYLHVLEVHIGIMKSTLPAPGAQQGKQTGQQSASAQG